MATIDNGAVQSALERDDPDTLSRLLEDVDARAELNNGWFGLSQPPLTAARSTAVVDVLIELGADPALVGAVTARSSTCCLPALRGDRDCLSRAWSATKRWRTNSPPKIPS